MPTPEGTLAWLPLSEQLDLVAPPVAAAAPAVPSARVARIDPALADTAQFCQEYDVALEHSANCVVVEGRRGERTTYAAVLVLAVDRADINRTVRKHLDVRKVSFASQEEAEALTGMRQGGITPVGLPEDWLLLIDDAVLAAGPVVVGAGERGAKLLVEAAEIAALPGAVVMPLALPRNDR